MVRTIYESSTIKDFSIEDLTSVDLKKFQKEDNDKIQKLIRDEHQRACDKVDLMISKQKKVNKNAQFYKQVVEQERLEKKGLP